MTLECDYCDNEAENFCMLIGGEGVNIYQECSACTRRHNKDPKLQSNYRYISKEEYLILKLKEQL